MRRVWLPGKLKVVITGNLTSVSAVKPYTVML